MTFKTVCHSFGLTSFVSLVTMWYHSQTACSVRVIIIYATLFGGVETTGLKSDTVPSSFGPPRVHTPDGLSWPPSLMAASASCPPPPPPDGSAYEPHSINRTQSHFIHMLIEQIPLCVNGLHCQHRLCFTSTPTTLKLLSHDVYQGFNTWLTTSAMSSS